MTSDWDSHTILGNMFYYSWQETANARSVYLFEYRRITSLAWDVERWLGLRDTNADVTAISIRFDVAYPVSALKASVATLIQLTVLPVASVTRVSVFHVHNH